MHHKHHQRPLQQQMEEEASSSPVSPRQHADIPSNRSHKGVPRMSSVTRHRETFIDGKVDGGLLDISVDEGAGLALDEGTRSIRFISAASNIDSVLGSNMEDSIMSSTLGKDRDQLKEQSSGERSVNNKAYNEDAEENASVKVKTLIALFETEPPKESITSIVDSEDILTKESSTKSVRQIATLFDEVTPSVISAEYHSAEDAFHSEENLQDLLQPESYGPVPYENVDKADQENNPVEMEIQKVKLQSKTKPIVAPLNTDMIEVTTNEDMVHKAPSKIKHLLPLTSPLTPMKNMLGSLKSSSRGVRTMETRGDEEDPSPFVEAEKSRARSSIRRSRQAEGGRTPKVLQKLPTLLRPSPRSPGDESTVEQGWDSPWAGMEVDVDLARSSQPAVQTETGRRVFTRLSRR